MSVAVGIARDQIFDARAVAAGRVAENARRRCSPCAPACRERVLGIAFLARGDGAHGGIKQRDLTPGRDRETARRCANVTSTRARPMARERQHFDASDPRGGVIPNRPAAHQPERLSDLLAAGAQGRAAPEIDHQGTRHLAMGLQVVAQDLLGGEAAEIQRGRRGQGARVGGEEIAPGRAARRGVRVPARRPVPARCGGRRARRGAPRARPRRSPPRPDQHRRVCLDGRPYTCRPSLMARSLRSHSQASILRRASSGPLSPATPGLARQRAALCGLDDQSRKFLAPLTVEPVGLRVFVDEALELTRVAGQAGAGERRRQVTDGERADPALGLRRFAWIADDERIDDGEWTDQQFRKARRGQRHGFAGEPLQRAVRAHVDERIDARDVAQPQREGDEGMARRQRRVVIIGAPFSRRGRGRAGARPAHCRTRGRGNETRRRARPDRRRGRPNAPRWPRATLAGRSAMRRAYVGERQRRRPRSRR